MMHLFRFQWPAALISTVLFLFALWITATYTKQVALAQLQEQARHRLRLFISHLQGELAKFETLPQLLATEERLTLPLTQETNSPLTQAINHYLKEVNTIIRASDTYLMNQKGLTVAASNWDSENPFVGRNFNYRPYFQEALQGKLGRYYALGTTSNKRGYYFAYPISDQDKTLGAIVVKVGMTSIEQTWQGGPDEFIVTDPNGIIFLTTRSQWKFKSLEVLSPEILQQVHESQRYRNLPITPLAVVTQSQLDDTSRTITITETTSPITATPQSNETFGYLMQSVENAEFGWSVHILSNLDSVQEQVYRTLLLVGFMFLLLVLTALFLYQRRVRIQEKVQYEQHARQMIEVSEARIRSIIHNTRAGLITTDHQGNVEFFNPMAEQMFIYEFEEVQGSPFTLFFRKEDRVLCQTRMLESKAWDHDFQNLKTIEVLGQRKDGSTFPTELTIGLVHDGKEDRYIVTVYDISERKLSEEALRSARDELEHRVQERTEDLLSTNKRLTQEIKEHKHTAEILHQTQDELIHAAKLAGLGQMSAAISHELNQPLAAIRSYSDNATRFSEHQRHDEVRWNLAQISDLTTRMAKIIKQLMVFAHKGSEKSIAVSLQATIGDSLSLMQSQLDREGVLIEKNFPQEDLFVLGDMVQLQQVFVNLISNTIQALSQSEQRVLSFSMHVEGDKVITASRDTGPGITDAHLPSLFDPFFTTKEAGEGLGLGLAISYRIIDSFGGTIKASNHPQGGAVFTITLPHTPSDKGIAV